MSQFLCDIVINYLKDMANRGDDEAKVLLNMIEEEQKEVK